MEMSTRNVFLAAVLLAACPAAAAVPTISGVKVVSLGRTVEIDYTLTGAPGIVTMDIQTNTAENAAGDWVSIGVDHFADTAGEVFCCVKEEGAKRLFWRPHRSWPRNIVKSGSARVVLTAWATNAPPDWLVIPLDKSRKRYYATGVPGGITNLHYKTDALLMRKVPAANVTWTMGAQDVKNVVGFHEVTLTEDYYLGIYELTRGQAWRMGELADEPAGENKEKPWVMSHARMRGNGYIYALKGHAVMPNPAIGFHNMRSNYNLRFDFPTEAQWEYAGHAGRGHTSGLTEEWVNERAWNAGNSGGVLHPVGRLKPNDWGFYDMLGNVKEHVLDLDVEWKYYETEEAKTDPYGRMDANAESPGSNLMMVRGLSITYASEYDRPWEWFLHKWSSKTSVYVEMTYADAGCRVCAPAVICD